MSIVIVIPTVAATCYLCYKGIELCRYYMLVKSGNIKDENGDLVYIEGSIEYKNDNNDNNDKNNKIKDNYNDDKAIIKELTIFRKDDLFNDNYEKIVRKMWNKQGLTVEGVHLDSCFLSESVLCDYGKTSYKTPDEALKGFSTVDFYDTSFRLAKGYKFTTKEINYGQKVYLVGNLVASPLYGQKVVPLYMGTNKKNVLRTVRTQHFRISYPLIGLASLWLYSEFVI